MRRILLVIIGVAVLGACSTELPHEASFDTNSPFEKQAKAALSGTIRLEGETDFSQVTVELQNDARTYSVDTKADGSVKLTGIVPGAYRLSVHTRYFEPFSDTVTIDLAEKRAIGPLTLRALRSDVLGSALIERLEQEEKVTTGGASLTLRKTGSIRSGASSSPRGLGASGLRLLAQAPTVEFQAVSGASGEYRFSSVPAGTYEVVAAATGLPAITIPNVQVTGEGEVTVDEVVLAPVTGLFRIAGKKADGSPDYQYTVTSAVTLELIGINAPKMQIGVSADGTVSACQLQAERTYDGLLAWNLGEPEGLKTVCVRYVGEDGTTSRTLTKSILYDRSAPNPVLLTPLFSNGYVKTDYLLVNVAAVDAGAGLASIKLGTWPDMATASTLPFQPTLQVALGADDEYVRYLWVVDAAGNASAMYRLAVTVDTQAPTLQANPFSVVGTGVTSDTRVTLAFNVTGATRLMVSEDSSFEGSSWLSYAPTKTFTLSSGDGDKTLYARVADDAGNIVNLAQQTIELDTTVPSSPYINIAVAATSATSIQISLGAAYVDEMIVSENSDFTGATWQTATPTTSYTFTGSDGVKTLYAKFRKLSGLETSVVSDSIVLDRTAPGPVLVTPLYNDGYVQTDYLLVNLAAVDAGSGVSTLKLGTGPDPTTAATLPFQSTLQVALGGDGSYTRYLWVLDAAGNASAMYTLAVTVDTQKPVPLTGLSIEGGSGETNERQVSLTMDVPDAVSMQVSESSSFAGAVWQPFTTSTLYTLSSGDGSKTVWARYRDAAGNVSDSDGASIWLDRTAPDNLTVTIDESSPSNVSEVTLRFSASGDASHVVMSENIGFVGALEEPYTVGPVVRPLSAGDGLHTIYVRVRDTAGNWSALASASILIDTDAPSFADFTITPPTGGQGGYIRSTSVPLTLSALNADQYQAQEGAFCGGSWAPFTTATSVVVSSGDGPKSISVRYRDAAGNQSLCLTKSVTLDETLPTGSIAINANAAQTNSRTVDVALSASGDASHLMISESAAFSDADWRPVTSATQWTFSAADGNRRLYLRLKDRAGNLSADSYDDILLDTVAPADPSIALESGANLTNKANINVSAAATGANYVRVANSASFSGASWLAYPASITSHALTSGDGLKAVYAQFKDEAGNLSAVVSDNIVKDTIVPSEPSVTVSEGSLTNSQTVTLVLSAIGADEVQIAGDIAGGATDWLSNRGTLSVTLALADDTNVISAQWRDAAGNYSDMATAYTFVDVSKPIDGAVTIAPAVLANNPNVTLALTYGDAVEMMVSNASGFVGSAWEPVSLTKGWTLSAGDGPKTVYVKYRDQAGNQSQSPVEDSVTLDTTPPTGASFTIDEGSATLSRTINLSLSASGASEVLSGNDSSFGGASWRGYAGSVTHYLTASDGLKVVYVKYRDLAGNESATLSQVTTLDTGAPALPQIVINAGAEYTKTASVTLSLNASDPTQMAFSDDGVNFTAWESFVPSKGYTLAGTDDTKTVWVKYRDAALNETSAVSDSIVLDTTAPSGTSIVVANGDAYTRTQTVIVTLTATDATWMQVSEDNSFSGMGWEPFAGTRQFVLSNGQGAKTVYARFKDEAGWVTGFVSDGITFDSVAPGGNSLAINGGVAYTKVTEVTLTINTNDATAEMRVSESSEFSGADWEPLAYTRAFTLSTGDGTKTVYLQLRDQAGNETGVLSRSISLDTQPPANAQVAINGNAEYATAIDGGVTLSLSANDAHSGVAMVRLSNTNVDGDLDGATAVAFGPSLPWTLEPNGAGLEGTRTVYAKFVDGAGNETPVAVTATTFYDTQAPTVGATPISINGDAEHATSTFVELTFDASAATQMMIGNEGVFTGAVWETYRSTLGWYLQSTQGGRSVAVKFRDAAGNETAAYADAITLDSQKPISPSLSVAGGSGYVTSTTITLDLSAANADYVQVSADGIFEAAPLEPYATSLPWTLSAGDGLKTIYVRFCDEAGNCTDTLATTIVLDTVAPTGNVVIANGAAYTRDITVNLAVNAADSGSGIEGLKLANTEAALATTNVVSYEATKVWTLGGASGAGIEETKWVWMQVVDRAGWSSAPVSDTIVYDRLAPVGDITLDAPGGVTNQTLIGVDLSYSGDTAWMKLSSGDACAGGNWVQASEGTLWTLPSIDGARWVSVRFRDNVLNESTCYTASVELDRTGPTPKTFVVKGNSGAKPGYTNTASLSITASTLAPDCDYAELAEDVGFIAPTGSGGCTLEALAYSLVDTSDGFHDVYLRYFDALGNAGAVTRATIILDQSTPTVTSSGGFQIVEGAFTNSASITLEMAGSGVDEMTVDQSVSCATSWEPYNRLRPWVLSGIDGPKTLSVRFRDNAANTTVCFSQQVTLDTQAPTFSASITGTEGVVGETARQVVYLTLTGVGGEPTQMKVSNTVDLSDANWAPVQTQKTWMLTSGDGLKIVYVLLRDAAGNVSGKAAPQILLDQTAPETPALQVTDTDGDGYALSNEHIELAWTAGESGAVVELQQLIGELQASFQTIGTFSSATTYSVQVTAPGYRYSFRVRSVDPIGNASAWSSEVLALPFAPIPTVTWRRSGDHYRFGFRPSRGTFAVNTVYYYEDATGYSYEVPLIPNQVDWPRETPDAVRYNEGFRIKSSNQDNSLVYEDEFLFTNLNFRQPIYFELLEGNIGRVSSARETLAIDKLNGLHSAGVVRDYGTGGVTTLYYARRLTETWTYDPVIAGADVRDNTLVMGPDGTPHITFQNADAGFYQSVFMYATRQGGVWNIETIADNPTGTTSVGWHSTLAVDEAGHAHTVHHGYCGADQLCYSANVTGSWNHDGLSPTGEYPTLAVLGGVPHVAYRYGGNVWYATKNTSGAWVKESLGSGTMPSIALEPDGTVHVAFAGSSSQLRHVAGVLGSFTSEDVGLGFTTGNSASLWIDKQNYIHITSRDAVSSGLVYSTNKSGFWESTLLHSLGDVGAVSDVVVGDRGELYVTYHDDQVGPLGGTRFLRFTSRHAQAWLDETIPGLTGSEYPTFGLTPTGEMMVGYRNTNPYAASNTTSAWVSEKVSTDYVYGVALALDPSGVPHMAYYDSTAGNKLQYATRPASTWVHEDVDGANFASSASTLGIYADDTAKAILYFDSDSDEVRFAAKTTTAWEKTLIEDFGTGSFSIRCASIARDSAGHFHVAFGRLQGGGVTLRYANNVMGAWSVEQITLGMGSNCSIDMSSGYPKISYQLVSGGLYLAERPAGAWTHSLVAGGNNVGKYGSDMIADAAGDLHLVYTGLDEITYSRFLDEWTPATLGFVNGSSPKIAIGPNGDVHVIYYDQLGALIHTFGQFSGLLYPLSSKLSAPF